MPHHPVPLAFHVASLRVTPISIGVLSRFTEWFSALHRFVRNVNSTMMAPPFVLSPPSGGCRPRDGGGVGTWWWSPTLRCDVGWLGSKCTVGIPKSLELILEC